ncbi:unnamed protein product [Amoebophrya sp. A25]|nr:unnamed protein product [Amoebophrya sp. A25]|eukprot:GSA25T00014567001.1
MWMFQLKNSNAGLPASSSGASSSIGPLLNTNNSSQSSMFSFANSAPLPAGVGVSMGSNKNVISGSLASVSMPSSTSNSASSSGVSGPKSSSIRPSGVRVVSNLFESDSALLRLQPACHLSVEEILNSADNNRLFLRFKDFVNAQRGASINRELSAQQKIELMASYGPVKARRFLAANTSAVKGESVKNWDSYLSFFRSYLNLMTTKGEKPFPLNAGKVEDFLSIYNNASTVNCARSALKKVASVLLLPFPDRVNSSAITRGVRRHQGVSGAKDPISPEFLNKILGLANLPPRFRMLYCMTWVFLLRCQDEAIPLRKIEFQHRKNLKHKIQEHSAVWGDDVEKTVSIRLKTRKNRLEGDVITRSCTCDSFKSERFLIFNQRLLSNDDRLVWARDYCPFCIFWKEWVQPLKAGARIFPNVAYADALKCIKLSAVKLHEPGDFGTHSLRRGGATTIASCGGSLQEILLAGRWSSRSDAWKRYVSMRKLECSGMLGAAKVSVDLVAEQLELISEGDASDVSDLDVDALADSENETSSVA